jgi:hypothetical protein
MSYANYCPTDQEQLYNSYILSIPLKHHIFFAHFIRITHYSYKAWRKGSGFLKDCRIFMKNS